MNPNPTVQLPGQWSTHAPGVDWIFYFIYWMSVVMFVGVVGTAMYFVWKYRRQPGVKAEPTGHNLPLEIGWTVAPLVLLVMLFHWGFEGYVRLTVPPANSFDIRVRARKWSWDFEYPNGAHSVNEVYVPLNRPVRMVISAEDVLHAFFVPAFRVKRDAVPGSYGTLWFEPTHAGDTHFYCAEYCGAADTASTDANGNEVYTGHFSMGGTVHVLEAQAFSAQMDRLNGPPDCGGRQCSASEWGQRLYTQQQCNTCHSVNGSPMTGPTWQNIFNHPVQLTDGSTVTIDEAYLRRSILQPQAQVVTGFNPVMPTYAGALTDRQVDALIEYIKTLH